MLSTNRSDFHALLFVSALLILNIAQSVAMDLSHDEAYYWVYSLFPAWGYYDHPPMVGWLIAMGSIFGKNEFAVRIPFALMQAGSVWIMWLLSERKNLLVFALALLSYPLVLAGGFLALPDTPLVFFSCLFWLLALEYRKNEKLWHPLAIALVIAAMFYSKYHALIVVLFTAAAMPETLKRKSFWLIVILAILFFLPHVYWQYQHDFISIDFHLNKRAGKGFAISNVFDYLFGVLALGGFVAFFQTIALGWKLGKQRKVLLFNSLGFFLFALALAFRNKVEANWTATAFAALIPLAAITISTPKAKKMFAFLCLPSVVILFSIRIILALPYDKEEFPIERLGEVKNWKKKTSKIFLAAKGSKVYADTYQLASKLSFYGDEFVHSLALGSRESQFLLIEKPKIKKDDKISYVGDEESPEAVEVDVGYGGPVYVLSGIPLRKVLGIYGEKYEETIRN